MVGFLVGVINAGETSALTSAGFGVETLHVPLLAHFQRDSRIAPESRVEGIRDRPFGSACMCTAIESLMTAPELYPISEGHIQPLERQS